ncbi:hypothetical protein JRG19_00160 [Pseudoclavibacter alba]|uniref:sensor histidine kinase n=1 Tax=Pseudoclavibacter albus TaxID=272241 RepID=UPI0019D319E4|nr:histidine kinase [Pseudoclavibacter alba]MBN6776966.1 hypothetical protein [Pseudoclavibacter alba]
MQRRRLRVHEWIVDILSALFLGLISWAPLDPNFLPFGPFWWMYWPALFLAVATLVIRRWNPGLSLILASLSAIAQMVAGMPPFFINFAQLFAVGACAAYGGKKLRWVSFGAALAGALVACLYTAFALIPGDVRQDPEGARQTAIIFVVSGAVYLTALVCAWALGYVRYLIDRSREAEVAKRIAEIEGEHSHKLVDSERERGRIAREMHDVLAHSLVVIATLSDGAKYVIGKDDEDAKRTVATIGEVSRDALADVRRLLAELRHEQEAGPVATFDERDSLYERFTELGLTIERKVVGEAKPLTPGASLAAYRVVQEGLTNALRHGDVGATVHVLERWSSAGLELEIRNRCGEEKDHALPSGGHGLNGLRERVLLEAGRFGASRAGNEFLLSAAIPVGQAQNLGDRLRGTHRVDTPWSLSSGLGDPLPGLARPSSPAQTIESGIDEGARTTGER